MIIKCVNNQIIIKIRTYRRILSINLKVLIEKVNFAIDSRKKYGTRLFL